MDLQEPRLFEGETLFEDGKPVGCRLVDRCDLLSSSIWKDTHVAVTRTYRRSGADLVATTVPVDGTALPRYLGPFEPVSALLALAFARTGMPVHAAEGFDRDMVTDCFRMAIARFPGRDPVDIHGRAKADLATARDACAPFLDTLDPMALHHGVKATFPPLSVDLYGSLDRTFDAPLLARAMEWFPNLGGLLRSVFDKERPIHPKAAQAVAEGRQATKAFLMEYVEKIDVVGNAVGPGIGETTMLVAGALDGLPDVDVARIAAKLGVPKNPRDPADIMARWLSRLPREWWPTSSRGWNLVADSSLALVLGQQGAYTPPLLFKPHHTDLAAYLGVNGDWQALANACEDACAHPGGPTKDGFSDALADMAETFARTLLEPVIHPPGPDGGPGPGASRTLRPAALAAALLRAGGTFAGEVALARAWLASRDDLDRGVARRVADDPRARWPKVLPDEVVGECGIVVLASVRGILDEGLWGADEAGMTGLDHAMGLRFGNVVSGRERVVSVRKRGPEGTVRLATARVGIGRKAPWLIEGAGRSGKPMPPEAMAALGTYIDTLATEPARYVGKAAAASRPGDPLAVHGYDPSTPGAWDAVLGLWDGILPERLRGVTREALATMAAGVDVDMPAAARTVGPSEVFAFGPEVDPADVEAMLARITKVGKPKAG